MEVIEIVVDGLYTFGEGMAERVYGWLEGQVGRVLEIAPGEVTGTAQDNRRRRPISISKGDADVQNPISLRSALRPKPHRRQAKVGRLASSIRMMLRWPNRTSPSAAPRWSSASWARSAKQSTWMMRL
jgi:hypothetical protein